MSLGWSSRKVGAVHLSWVQGLDGVYRQDIWEEFLLVFYLEIEIHLFSPFSSFSFFSSLLSFLHLLFFGKKTLYIHFTTPNG